MAYQENYESLEFFIQFSTGFWEEKSGNGNGENRGGRLPKW